MALDGVIDPLMQPDSGILDLRIGANQIAKGPEAYEIGNETILRKRKREVLYKNGVTLPVTAERLMAEAERKTRHSAKLARNMKDAGQGRPVDAAPKEVSAHHIVAAMDTRAEQSRMRLFGWRIGINDVDNGVFLPAYKNTAVSSLPNATKHVIVHTDTYHLNVRARLRVVPSDDHAEGRLALRQIKKELVDGVFPY